MRPILLATLLIGLIFPSLLQAQERLRIAIMAEGEAAPFGDLLMAGLTAGNTAEIVERAELDRLGAEASLAALGATERPIAMARLAKADALLLASIDTAVPARPRLLLRLTSVADGTVRHGVVLPWEPKELAATSALAIRQLQAPLTRLPAKAAKPLYLSLQGLRGAIGTAQLAALEISINTQLAHRLASIPGIVVTERWQMDDLVFERALQPLSAPKFQTGALLIDGSLDIQDGKVAAQLRTRRSESDPGKTRMVAAENGPALVEALVAALIQDFPDHAEKPPALNSEVEARAYLDLAEWLMKFNLPTEGAQAIESAIALGLQEDRARKMRVWAYARCAFPDSSGMGLITIVHGTPPATSIPAGEIPYRLVAARRACEYAFELNAGVKIIPNVSVADQPIGIGNQAFFNTVRLLRSVVNQGAHLENAERVRQTRDALGQLVAGLEKTVLKYHPDFLTNKACYAAYWCGSAEETLAYYRTALKAGYYGRSATGNSPFSTEVRVGLFGHALNAPFFDREPNRIDEKLKVGPQRLVDWTKAEPAATAEAWKSFLAELRASPELASQADAWAFELASTVDPANRRRVQIEMTKWFLANGEAIVRDSSSRVYASMKFDFDWLVRQPESAASLDQMVNILCRIIDITEVVPTQTLKWIQEMAAADPPSNLTTVQVARLKNALGQYLERAFRNPKLKGRFEAAISRTFDSLEKVAPQAVTAEFPPLPVTTAWVPARRLVSAGGDRPQTRSMNDRLLAEGKEVFFQSSQGVVGVNLETMQASVTPPLEFPHFNWRILPTATDIWAANDSKVMRISRKGGGTWQSVDLPPWRYAPFPVGDRVYAVARQIYTNTPGGEGLYDVSASPPKLIFSTRRRPAEHPLDNAPYQAITSGIAGFRNQPWIACFAKPPAPDKRSVGLICFAVDQPASPALEGLNWRPTLKTDGQITLLREAAILDGKLPPEEVRFSFAGLWRLDPARTQLEVLLHDPEKSARVETATPRWPLPAKFKEPSQAAYSCITYRDELWILRWKQTKAGATDLEIYGFLPGRKSAVRIPLQLVVSAADLAALRAPGHALRVETLTEPSLSFECLTCTDFGLAFSGSDVTALWIVPWADLHAWIQAQP